MIYELAIVAKPEVNDETVASLTELLASVVKDFEGEILIQDDWGTKFMAQATSAGVQKGRYLYFIYTANAQANVEITRRLKINENVMKQLFVKLGEEADREAVIKAYKTPFSKKYNGSVTDSPDEEGGDVERDRKRFARRKNCWFTAKSIKADWKDPATYSWLVSEFGKISPARISGINRKNQIIVNAAIKRARQIGIISHMSNRIAE